jgi:mRNA interferase RelE/StbE
MRKLLLTHRAHDFLNELSAKSFRQVGRAVLSLLKDPRPQDSKLLTGFPYYRIDIGEYRIVYRFDEETLSVLLIGKRNDGEVYKELKRLF